MEELAPELVHKIALEGWLEFSDVEALSKTCRRMASILMWDEYGRDVHYALLGVVENVREGRWSAARYAVCRRWFRGEDGGEESVWKRVIETDVANDENDLAGWEKVMLATLSLPGASGCLESWRMGFHKRTSLLHAAVKVGSERLVEWVVERGGDLEEKNSERKSPLWAACRYGHVGVVRVLVEHGADMVGKDLSQSALIAASQGGCLEVMRYLLGLGVLDVEARDGQGHWPLSCACDYGDLDMVKVLVEEGGADVDVEGKAGQGPLFWACRGGKVEIVRLLVDAGSGSGAGKEEDAGVWAAGLGVAAAYGHVEVVRELLDMGVGVDGVTNIGDTALALASQNGHTDIVRMLAESGADVDKRGCAGFTPLHYACEGGCEHLVRILLEAGADAEVVDDEGDTALDVATRGGWGEIVEVLEEWG